MHISMCILYKFFAFLLLFMCIHIYCNTMYTVFKNIGGTQYGSACSATKSKQKVSRKV